MTPLELLQYGAAFAVCTALFVAALSAGFVFLFWLLDQLP